MNEIGADDARDHLAMVERILAETQPRLCSGGEYFVVWGIVSALLTLLGALVHGSMLPRAALLSVPILLAAAAVFSIVRSRQTRSEIARSSLLQREFFNVLVLTLGAAFIVNAGAWYIFSGLASAAIWSVAEAIVLLYIGMHGNRRARIAGALMVASVLVANAIAAYFGEIPAAYVLAAGMVAGYAGFGLAEMLAHD